MKKRIDFNSAKEAQLDEKIRNTLEAQFELPESVSAAKQNALKKISEGAAGSLRPLNKKKRFRKVWTAFAGTAAAGAVFSAVCITNPALAANIPVVGSVFEKIGKSLGFSGDYADYAKPLEQENAGTQETADSGGGEEAGRESAYRKTVDGVTVTLSEVYCNDQALYLSMLIESQETLPETITDQDGTPVIDIIDSELQFSYNKSFRLLNAYLDGKMLDAHTYAGVLRVEMEETKRNNDEMKRFYEDRNAFLKEKGFDMENMEELGFTFEDVARELGMEEFSDEQIAAIGGPDKSDYDMELEIPEKFTADLTIHKIRGKKSEAQDTTPEMPKELKDAYTQAMAENGLDEADYESFTEEEKETEHRLFTEMWNQYYELYPETMSPWNVHNSWEFAGDWDFSLEVEMDRTRTVTKEINMLDEDGNGIVSVARTPFELIVDVRDPELKYFPVALDADGEPMPYGKFGSSVNVMAIQDRDVSTIYLYLCEEYEYLDELKGYYYSDDYEIKKKTKSFKEYLDERAVLKTEVSFGE